MNSRVALEAEYSCNRANYERLMIEAKFILETDLNKTEVKTHALLGRIKDIDSVLKKVERIDASGSLDEITDLVGLRVICLLRSDIAKIGDLIRSAFFIVSEDNKIEGQDVASFGYQSVHFVAQIKPEYLGPRYENIKELMFEIQVRTIAMDAWASVSHYLDYKSQYDVPRALRKDFYALSGLFYVVDTHFEMFYQAGENSRVSAIDKIGADSLGLDVEINIDTLRAYASMKFKGRKLSELDVDGYSELVTELKQAGYELISDLDAAVTRGWEAFLAYEEKRPPGGNLDKGKKTKRKYSAIGVVRVLMSIVDVDYLEARENKPQIDHYSDFRSMIRKS